MTTTWLVGIALTPAVLAYVVLAFRDPLRWVLPPYAVLIPFSSLVSVVAGPFGSLSSLLGLLLGVALLAQLATTRRSNPRLSLAIPIWLAYLGVCALSYFWSVAPQMTASSVVILGGQVLLFTALSLSRMDRVALRRFETATIIGGVLVVLYGLAQLFVLGGLPSQNGGSGRLGADLLGANNQAGALLLPVALAGVRALTGPLRWRLVNSVATLGLVLGVVMTGSRGGTLACVVTVAAVVFFCSASRASKVALTVAAMLLLGAVLAFQPAGVGSRQVARTDSSSGRSDIWRVAAHACPQYCLQGAGWGTFPVVYGMELEQVPTARVLVQGVAYQPHDIFLLALMEAGLPGLILLLAGLAVALFGAMRLPLGLRAPPTAAMAGTIVSSIFLSNLEFKFVWAALAYPVLCAAVAATERAARTGPSGQDVPALPRQREAEQMAAGTGA